MITNNITWICTTCGAKTVITSPNLAQGTSLIRCTNTDDEKHILLSYTLIECPNADCQAQSFSVTAKHGTIYTNNNGGKSFKRIGTVGIGEFTFIPTTTSPLSAHSPSQVSNDYAEAFLIKNLSPKASATLARRALQGMVRDFFQIKDKRTLHQELEAIKDQCDSELYEALMAVKSIGNIGAHPEQDASLMVDVEPGEAETLLQLIHLLDQEWYVQRAARAQRLRNLKMLADSKEAARTPPSP